MSAHTGRTCLGETRAFTLVELVVVMAVIAIVASYAVPRISDFLFSDHLKLCSRRLVGLVHQASQLAQQRQQPYVLRYRDSQRIFFVEPEQETDKQRDEEASKRSRDRELPLPELVSVRDIWTWYDGIRAAEEYVIRFSKEGYVEPTIIHLRDSSGTEHSIVLSPFLGKVQIIDGYVSPDKDKSNPFQ